jgi:hypothetical protein
VRVQWWVFLIALLSGFADKNELVGKSCSDTSECAAGLSCFVKSGGGACLASDAQNGACVFPGGQCSLTCTGEPDCAALENPDFPNMQFSCAQSNIDGGSVSFCAGSQDAGP